MFTVAVDVMGGDLGPRVAFQACKKFLKSRPDVHLIVAVTQDFADEAESFFASRKSRVRILPCETQISMQDKPAQMLRQGLKSTMAAVLREHQQGRAQGVLSVGNTGALMVLARHLLGTLPGMDRPALATLLPTRQKPLLMLDLGANLGVSADQLVQFACIGAAWSKVQCAAAPRLGLLNVGRESTKGTDNVRQAAEQLQRIMPDYYVGFYEGDDLYRGELDVLITDGFAGNIALKASEGLSEWLSEQLHSEFRNTWFLRWLSFLWAPAIARIERRISPARHGGALLLGLDGVVVKTHGKSNERAYRHALEYLLQKVERFDKPRLLAELNRLQNH